MLAWLGTSRNDAGLVLRGGGGVRHGLTLVESLAALAILSAAFLAVVSTASVGHKHLHAAETEFRVVRVARDLMEEIVSKAYLDPDVADVFGREPADTARTKFNDVNDFIGFTEAAGQLRDMTAAPYPADHQGFSREVSVVPAVQTVTAWNTAVSGVTVTVTVREQPKGKVWKFSRFIPEPLH